MAKIRGITVKLYEKKQRIDGDGNPITDGFGKPIYDEIPIEVENVLVTPSSSDDIITNTDLTGKKAVYTIAIPKGDTHDWENKRVEFFGEMFKTFDVPVKGIDEMIPLNWNMKVKVERYE